MLTVDLSQFPVINTQRLLLKEIKLQDAADLLVFRSNIDAMRYIDRPLARTIEDAETLIHTMDGFLKNNVGISWGICLKEDARLIGTIGFWNIDTTNYRAEFGYMLEPVHHRKGIMTEAFAPVIDYAFNEVKLHSLEARVNPENTASRMLLEKNSFVQEAYFKENYFYNNKFSDTVVYTLLNKG